MFESLKKKLKTMFTSEEPEKKAKKKSTKTKKEIKKTKNAQSKEKEKKKTEEKQNLKTEEQTKPKTKDSFLSKIFRERTDEIKKEVEEIREEKESFISKIFSNKKTITKENIEEIFSELEIVLLENNVALEVVDKIRESVTKELVGKEVKKEQIENQVTEALKNAISSVLIEPPNLLELIKSKSDTFVIVFFGINGSGKTTSIAKLAHYLKKNNISCVLGAGDTFRAASIEQLETHAERLKIPVVKQSYNSDPAAVAFDTIAYAKKNHIKCALIDTAGRMYTKENLMKEMEKIIRISKPDLKIFVGESITGNDATEQARTFNESINLDGIILSKADVDDKGGTALSVSYITGKPIFFLGVGQNYDDLKPFKKETIIKNLGLD